MEAGRRSSARSFCPKVRRIAGPAISRAASRLSHRIQRDRARSFTRALFAAWNTRRRFFSTARDHLRTRLTHTIEVASISRTIARALRLNEDLAETIASAHDLGHSPFGHSGEEMLAECMREHGGFEHNRQSLRVVELLENPYPNFPGLNLTLEGGRLAKNQVSSLEAQIAIWPMRSLITVTTSTMRSTSTFLILRSSKSRCLESGGRFGSRALSGLAQPDLHKLIIRDVIDRQVGT